MKKGYKPSDRIYSDFEGGDNVAKSKLLWCKNCERWIPPPYVHTCYNAKAARESERKIGIKHEEQR